MLVFSTRCLDKLGNQGRHGKLDPGTLLQECSRGGSQVGTLVAGMPKECQFPGRLPFVSRDWDWVGGIV